MQYLGVISKTMNDLCLFPRKPFNITVIQVYAPTTNAKEAEVEQFDDDLQDLHGIAQVRILEWIAISFSKSFTIVEKNFF